MKNTKRLGARFLGSAAILVGLACDQPQVAGPSVADFQAERSAMKEQIAQSPKPAANPAAVSESDVEAAITAQTASYRYDPTGKRDPFRSFIWERPEILAGEPTEGPLEKFDIGQLSLLAVGWKTGNARALVQDPSGGNYIVAEGARVGKNSGRVTHIEDGLVVVRETYVDYLGQETQKNIEMRMRRNEGG